MCLFQGADKENAHMHFVETDHSLLREVPGIEVFDYKVSR